MFKNKEKTLGLPQVSNFKDYKVLCRNFSAESNNFVTCGCF